MTMKVQKPALAALLGATAFFLPAQVALSDGNSPATVAGAPEGFIISINGETLTGDDRVRDDIRRTDVQLAQAEADGVEEGSDQTALRRIPVYSGAVTVSGSGVPAGASVSALGERIRPDASGGFVVQRILPAGDYPVNVQVRGAGQNVDLTRDVDIPVSEWFYVAVADLMVGRHRDGLSGNRTTYQDGRLSAYVDGRTENGVQITASVDTGNDDLKDIFRRLQDKDPRQLSLRFDPKDLYPTYGDDSTSVDNTPTSGRVYLRIEREGNYIQFGDFDANLDGNTLVSNSRALYGAQAAYATPQTTDAGEARARFTAYAAQPDQLAQRDVFLGTGGTVYFLERQDIQSGTARLFAQVRDADTGRIIKTVELQPGTDFTINNIQGIVTLTRPLSGSVDSGLIIQGSDPELVLVAQYEYTPTLTNIDGFAFGGRGEVWATDQLRFGANAMVDESGSTDHKAIGVDVLWRLNDDTYLSAEIARTEGTGFTSTFSNDGGLIVNSDTLATGSGEAVKLDGRVSLADLGYDVEGSVGGYFEHRREGFSNLDYQVLSTTGDETLWGVYADIAPRENLKYAFYADSYENDAGKVDRTFGAETRFALNDRTELGLGVEYVDLNTASDKGTRTDIAARLEHSVSEDLDVYAFGQSSVSVNGLDHADRYGVGTVYRVGDNWTLSGEISDGTEGQGGA